jgi:hypothetical protein
VDDTPSASSRRYIGLDEISAALLQDGGSWGRRRKRHPIHYNVIDAEVAMYHVAFGVQILEPCKTID